MQRLTTTTKTKRKLYARNVKKDRSFAPRGSHLTEFTQPNNVVCPLFHPVLFSVCQCRRCNWGLALDKGKNTLRYLSLFCWMVSGRFLTLSPLRISCRRGLKSPPHNPIYFGRRMGRYGDASKRGARPISHDERQPAKLASLKAGWNPLQFTR